jgi:hypothetical protein
MACAYSSCKESDVVFLIVIRGGFRGGTDPFGPEVQIDHAKTKQAYQN